MRPLPLAPPGGGSGGPDGPDGNGGVGGGGTKPCPDKDTHKATKNRDSRADKMRDRVRNENSGASVPRNNCNFDGDPNTKWVPAHIDNGQVISGACMIKK